MRRIASPKDLEGELRRLLLYAGSVSPSRTRLAMALRALADRVTVRVAMKAEEVQVGHNYLMSLAHGETTKVFVLAKATLNHTSARTWRTRKVPAFKVRHQGKVEIVLPSVLQPLPET